MKKLALLLPVVVVAASCSLKPISFGGVQDSKVNSLSQKGIDAEFGLKIKNPNGFGFRIYKSEMNLSVNGMDLGTAKLKKGVKIRRKSESVSTFQVVSDFSKLNFSELTKLATLSGGKSANVTLKGELKVGNLFYKKRFPVDLTQRIPLGK